MSEPENKQGSLAAECLANRYELAKIRSTDINEHIATFREYATKVDSVCECGVRTVVSTWGFLAGLALGPEKGKPTITERKKRMLCVDLDPCPNIELPQRLAKELGIQLDFVQANDLDIDLSWGCDLLFVDSLHCLPHLRRELATHHAHIRKYIIMHDTTVDAYVGEPVRMNYNIPLLAKKTGYPEAELRIGLRPAIAEFLQTHKDTWTIDKVFENNNGLTILRRIGS